MKPFFAALALAALPLQIAHAAGDDIAPRSAPWPAEVEAAMRELPVMSQGRVKPFMTQVQYLLLRLKEVRSLRLPDDDPKLGEVAGEKLSPTAWALDVLLHPAQAADYPVFRVTDSEELDWVDLSSIVKKRRDSYSWNELSPAYERIWEFRSEYMKIDPKRRSRLQNQIVDLAADMSEYAGLMHAFDVLRARFPADGSPALREVFGARAEVRFSDVLAVTPELLERYSAIVGGDSEVVPDGEHGAEAEAIGALLEHAFQGASSSGYLAFLPPPDPTVEEWLTLETALLTARDWSSEQRALVVSAVARAEALVDAAGAPEALAPAVHALSDEIRVQALARGEAEKVPLEVRYLRGDYFGKALIGFVLAFVLSAVLWLRPRNRWLALATAVATAVPTGFLVYGIVLRCVLRGRPPVSTLYETILFITACGVLVALIVEWIHRQRIALSLAAALGALGMFVAYRFELTDGQDTMPQLVAVLDTNFWLATHVTTVTVGYSAGLLAGFVAYVYLLGKLVGWRRAEPRTYQLLGRMVYGVLCFGLLFSTVGTILGGIWANYSWGRFWGWDPKENGALMIVLWELMILHGRMGGFWRDWGTALLAVLGNIVVAFSWWGVNLMGVGLHSYGFTAGLKQAVTIFYGAQLLVVGLGGLAWFLERRRIELRAQAVQRERAASTAVAEIAPEPGA